MDEMTAEAGRLVKLPERANQSGGATTRKKIDPEDAQAIQSLYRRNRRRAVRLIVEGEGTSCDIDTRAVEDHYRSIWATSDCDLSMYRDAEGRDPIQMGRLDRKVVAKKLHHFENTAPGDDGLTYQHWKKLDPTCHVLTEVLNVCASYTRKSRRAGKRPPPS